MSYTHIPNLAAMVEGACQCLSCQHSCFYQETFSGKRQAASPDLLIKSFFRKPRSAAQTRVQKLWDWHQGALVGIIDLAVVKIRMLLVG